MILSTLSAEDQARLTTECQLRWARHCERARDDGAPPPDELDIWVCGWWSAIEAMENPRPLEAIERDLALIRARTFGLTK